MYRFTCRACHPVWVLFLVWSVFCCSIENFFPAILFCTIATGMYPKIVRSWYKHVFISLNILYLSLCLQHKYAACNLCIWICTHVSVWEGGTPFELMQQYLFIIKKGSFATWCSAHYHKLIFHSLNVSYLAAFYLYCGQCCGHFFEEVKQILFLKWCLAQKWIFFFF